MSRRALALTLLAIVALPLLGTLAFAAVCFEPCPDDADGSTCAPLCATCATCTHSRQAILQIGVDDVASVPATHTFPPQVFPSSSMLASDIFHVPLRG